MSPSDFTLLERWHDRRDAKAFQEIVSRHGAMVYSVCRRILGNSADTEEVAQECFLALAQAETKNIQTLGGWLHTSATHRSLDRVRGDKRRKQRERRYTDEEAQVSGAQTERGIKVNSFRFGERGQEPVTTGPDGRYTIIGLNEGEWYVQLDDNNPVFSSDTTESIPRAYVRVGETTTLDFSVDRSISISGRVVNPEGEPVSEAGIDVVLFLNEGTDRHRRGYFNADAQGEFTFWGGFTTERAVFSARKGELKSSAAVRQYDSWRDRGRRPPHAIPEDKGLRQIHG